MSGAVGDATGVDFDTIITRIASANAAMDKLLKKADKVYKKLGEVNDLNEAAGGNSFSTPANIPGSGNGGSPNIPAPPGSAGGGMNKWMSALNFAKGAVNLTSALLPDAAQGINRQQMRYDTSIQMGGASPLNNARYRNQEVGIGAAMSGRMANVQSAYQVGQVAATTSIVNTGGGQTGNASNLAAFAAAGFKNTGIDNATLAQAHANMATSANFNNQALAMGIRTHDSKGNYLTGDALYSQIYNRLGIAGKTPEQIQTQMASGRQIGNFLQSMGMSDTEKQNAQAWFLNKNADPNYTSAGDTETSKESPRDSSSALVQAQSDYVGTGMEAAVKGYEKMNGALTIATEKLEDLYKALGPLADAMQQLAGAKVAYDNSGAAKVAGGGIGDAVSALAGGYMASKAGSALKGAFKSGGTKGALKTAAKQAGSLAKKGLRFGPGLLAAAGTMALEHVGRADGNVSNIDMAGSIAGGAASGALTGAALASVIPIPIVSTAVGAVAGGVIGAIGGWWGAHNAKKDLEAEAELEAEGVNLAAGDIQLNGLNYNLDPNQPAPSKAIGDWNVSKNQLAKLHQNEMVLPADVAESFRSAVQNHVISGSVEKSGRSGSGMVKVDVTLNNASWNEAQRLVKIVQEAVDTTRSLELLAST